MTGLRLLFRLRERKGFRRLCRLGLRLLSIDIPPSVVIGHDLHLYHRWFGVVINRKVEIGDRVHIFHNVTIGRADVFTPESGSDYGGIMIEDDVWLCPGAVVLGGPGRTVVGEGTVVAANAVLTESTGDWEIWAGVPAHRIGNRRIDRDVDELARIRT
jgi:serine O-acetyltransferase